MAFDSLMSPSGVEVPCAFTYWISSGVILLFLKAARMATWLDGHLPEGTRILCSPARRAEQTVLALGRRYKLREELAPLSLGLIGEVTGTTLDDTGLAADGASALPPALDLSCDPATEDVCLVLVGDEGFGLTLLPSTASRPAGAIAAVRAAVEFMGLFR